MRVPGWRPLVRGLRLLTRRSAADRDVADEVQHYLDEAMAAHAARGLSRLEARRAAGVELGSVTSVREQVRGYGWEHLVHSVAVDLRYAARRLWGAPGFTIVATLTLALGIGANTAVFNLVHTVLLAPLPVGHPDQLVALSHANLERSGGTGFPYQFFRELEAERQVLDGVLARGGSERVTFGTDAGGEPAIGELVSGSFFDVLGVHPAAGRLFTREDDLVPGAHPVVVLSDAFWQRRFGRDPAVVGRIVLISGSPMTIVGVTPSGFDGLDPGQRVDLRIPLAMQAEVRGGRTPPALPRRAAWELQIVARLRPGVSLEQAEVAVSAALTRSMEQDGSVLPERIALRPAGTGFGSTRRRFETALWVLMSITVAILAIACVNLALLFAARSGARGRELALRAALGAGIGRLAGQLLIESVLLAACGAVLGAAVAYLGAAWLARLASGSGSTLLLEARPHAAVLLFHFAVALVSGTLCGLGPVLRVRRQVRSAGLRGSGRTGTGTARHWLIVAQVALSVVVLVGAALFLQTIRALRSADLGFRPDHLLLVALDPKTAGATDSEVVPFFRSVRARLLALPGITDVTFSTARALSNSSWSAAIRIDGQAVDPAARAFRNAVGPGYFHALRTPLVTGRDFDQSDDGAAPMVAVINESFARTFLGSRNPLGEKIGSARPEYTIVGVARDTRHVHVRDAPAPTWYVPYEQRPGLKNLDLIVRTTGDPERMVPEVRAAIASVDSRVALFEVRTQMAQIDDMLVTERVVAMLAAIFAGIAAMLAALGLYGLLAFFVSQRRHEIAIRMALGAEPRSVVRAIGGGVWQAVGAGIASGVIAGVVLAGFVRTILYGVSPADAPSLTAAALTMAAVASCASLLPLWRATSIDPGTVLRQEPQATKWAAGE